MKNLTMLGFKHYTAMNSLAKSGTGTKNVWNSELASTLKEIELFDRKLIQITTDKKEAELIRGMRFSPSDEKPLLWARLTDQGFDELEKYKQIDAFNYLNEVFLYHKHNYNQKDFRRKLDVIFDGIEEGGNC